MKHCTFFKSRNVDGIGYERIFRKLDAHSLVLTHTIHVIDKIYPDSVAKFERGEKNETKMTNKERKLKKWATQPGVPAEEN